MRFNLINILITIIFALPLFAIIFDIVFKCCETTKLFQYEIGLLLVAVFSLSLIGQQDIRTPLSFMQSPITLSIARTPIFIFSVILLALFITVLISIKHKIDSLSRYEFVLINIALSFGFIAFISGQFMIRYIALDMVGLLAALIVLKRLNESNQFNDFIVIFQSLRFGDLCLLASILMLNRYANTLEISQMISSASEMPNPGRTWVLIGFLIAVMIKIGIWPFGLWLRRARKSTGAVSFWISGILMPALGFYLLYRVIPIIKLNNSYELLVFILGLTTMAMTLLFQYLGLVKHSKFSFLSAITGSILLCVIALIQSPFFVYCLIGLLSYRIFIFLDEESMIKIPKYLGIGLPFVINGLFIWLNAESISILTLFICVFLTLSWAFTVWIVNRRKLPHEGPILSEIKVDLSRYGLADMISRGALRLNEIVERDFLSNRLTGNFLTKAALWLNQTLEVGVLSQGIDHLGQWYEKIANWNFKYIEGRLEMIWTWVSRMLMQLSEGTLSIFEKDAAEKAEGLMGNALKTLEVYEENVLKKRLRWDLAWIPLLLIGILIFLMVA